MELVVRIRGRNQVEIEAGLSDVLGLVQDGYTDLPAGQDPEGAVQFELRGQTETVWCESHTHDGGAPHFERDDCVYPHLTNPATRARMNGRY